MAEQKPAGKIRLVAQASGDGCISFGWVDEAGNGIDREVTEKDALRHLRSRASESLRRLGFNVFHIPDRGYVLARVMQLNGRDLYIAQHRDISGDCGNHYRLLIERPDQRPYTDGQLHLTFPHRTLRMEVAGHQTPLDMETTWYEVKSLSIRIAVLFYLNHREIIDKGGKS